jgi:hypothetical protein
MEETTQGGPEPSGDEGPSASKGLPAWAWSVIGVVVGAALIGGAWMLYESGRSAGEHAVFDVASIETSGTQGADASADASATADDTATAQAADGPSSSGGASSSGGSGGSSGGSSSSGSSSGGGSSGSGSSPGLPAPPTPITPSKPSLKQKAPVALWTTKLTKSHSGSWTSDQLTYSTSQHLRLVISVVEGDGSGNMTVKFVNPQVNGWSHQLFSTAHATTGATVTSPSQDVEPGRHYEVRVTADSDVSWSVKVQTRP